jgi:DNA-binding transcriptional ArsR family regulator
MKRFDLLNHPVRLRIAQLLYGRQLSTAQIHELLGNVPKPSLYRHLSRLLEGGVIEVVETRTVKGIEERIYTTVKDELNLTKEDQERGVDANDFADFVRVYGTLAADEMANVVAAEATLNVQNLAFRDYEFAATDEEFADLCAALWRLLDEAEQRPLTDNRRQRRLLVLSFPMHLRS